MIKKYFGLAFGLLALAAAGPAAGPLAAGTGQPAAPALQEQPASLSAQAAPALQQQPASLSAQAGPALQLAAGTGQPAGPVLQQNANPAAGNAANGRKLFVSFGCYQCHGYEAQGGAAGPRLAPRPIAYQQFMKYVRHPTNQMPPFTEKTVTDAQLNDIYAFLRAQPAPPDVDTIPLLK